MLGVRLPRLLMARSLQPRATAPTTSARYREPVLSRLLADDQASNSPASVGIASTRWRAARAARFSAVGSPPFWIAAIAARASFLASFRASGGQRPSLTKRLRPSGPVARTWNVADRCNHFAGSGSRCQASPHLGSGSDAISPVAGRASRTQCPTDRAGRFARRMRRRIRGSVSLTRMLLLLRP